MASKDEILRALPKLKGPELAEVARAVKALLSLSNYEADKFVTSIVDTGVDDFLLQGIAHYLEKEGVTGSGSRAVYHLTRMDGYKHYKDKRPDLDIFLKKLLSSQGTKGNRHQAQIAYLCASALADLLRARKIFSVGAMLTQVNKIPEALDAAFPGYVQGGLFGFILLSSEK